MNIGSESLASGELSRLDRLRRVCSGCSLRNLCLPAGLDQSEIEALEVRVEKRRQLKAREYLHRAGDPSTAIYVVRFGSLKSYRLRQDGELQIVGLHLPGELFGMDALADDHHQLSTQALETSSICALPLVEMDRIMRDIPNVNRQILGMMSREMGEASENHVLLARRAAAERVALFLCRYIDRLIRVGMRANSFELAISRQDLANYLGLQIETVSRAFGRLRDQGIIQVDRRLIDIKDAAALRREAGLNADGQYCA